MTAIIKKENSMWGFYLIALLPLVIGLCLWIFDKQVTWQEWLGSAAAGFVLAGIMHLVAVAGMTDDVETWSGEISLAKKYGEWQEWYQEAIYRTEVYYTGSGKDRQMHTRRVFDHWEARTRWHREYWMLYSNIDTEYGVDKPEYLQVVKDFGDIQHPVAGVRRTMEHNSKMIAGDPNDYESRSVSGYIYPVTDLRHFENRIKAAPTLFSFVKVPSNMPVHTWPKNPNWRQSERLMGHASKLIDIKKWDDMNARLGPLKLVNVIMVGFINKDTMMGDWQQAKWIGGKKNDLVICFDMDTKDKVAWSQVFGWTEREDCKRNLETILLTNPINDDIIPLIEKEIRHSYIIKDWSKFDYITIEPPRWSYVVYILLMLMIQGGLYFWFHVNEFVK